MRSSSLESCTRWGTVPHMNPELQVKNNLFLKKNFIAHTVHASFFSGMSI